MVSTTSPEQSVYLQFSTLPAGKQLAQEYVQNNFIPLEVQQELVDTQVEMDAQADLLGELEREGGKVDSQLCELQSKVKAAQKQMLDLQESGDVQRRTLQDLMALAKSDHRVLRQQQHARAPGQFPSSFFLDLVGQQRQRVDDLANKCEQVQSVLQTRRAAGGQGQGQTATGSATGGELVAALMFKQHQAVKLQANRVAHVHAKLRQFKLERNIQTTEVDLEEKQEREREARLLRKLQPVSAALQPSVSLFPQQQQQPFSPIPQQQQQQQQPPMTPFANNTSMFGGGMQSPFGGPDLMATPSLFGTASTSTTSTARKRKN